MKKYRAFIHWEMKGDSADIPWDFKAKNDVEAIEKARQHVKELDEQAKREAEEAHENRDGWPSLSRLHKIERVMVELEKETPVLLT
jgi:hypothetical protein